MSTLKIVRCLALPGVLEAGSMYLVRNQVDSSLEVVIVGNDGVTQARSPTKTDILSWINLAIAENGPEILSRDISATGDATWSVSFDSSADVSGVLTLATTGVAAGAYGNISIDAKGRVTEARALTAADIPSLPGSKITSSLTVNTSGNADTATLAAVADKAVMLQTPRTINGVNFDGTANITVNAVDATDRIAASEKAQPNGVATLDSSGVIPAAQLPSYVDDVVEVDALDKLPGNINDPLTNGAASKGKIYVVTENDVTKIYRWSGTQYISIPDGVGVSDSALQLETARSISVTGDAAWTVTFDGSQNATSALTLATTGVAAGVYSNVEVDAKGRVLTARAIEVADIPQLTYTTVVSAASLQIVADW